NRRIPTYRHSVACCKLAGVPVQKAAYRVLTVRIGVSDVRLKVLGYKDWLSIRGRDSQLGLKYPSLILRPVTECPFCATVYKKQAYRPIAKELIDYALHAYLQIVNAGDHHAAGILR